MKISIPDNPKLGKKSCLPPGVTYGGILIQCTATDSCKNMDTTLGDHCCNYGNCRFNSGDAGSVTPAEGFGTIKCKTCNYKYGTGCPQKLPPPPPPRPPPPPGPPPPPKCPNTPTCCSTSRTCTPPAGGHTCNCEWTKGCRPGSFCNGKGDGSYCWNCCCKGKTLGLSPASSTPDLLFNGQFALPLVPGPDVAQI